MYYVVYSIIHEILLLAKTFKPTKQNAHHYCKTKLFLPLSYQFKLIT